MQPAGCFFTLLKTIGSRYFATEGWCDSFIYINPDVSDSEQTINLSGYLSLVVESGRTDEEIDKCAENGEYGASQIIFRHQS